MPYLVALGAVMVDPQMRHKRGQRHPRLTHPPLTHPSLTQPPLTHTAAVAVGGAHGNANGHTPLTHPSLTESTGGDRMDTVSHTVTAAGVTAIEAVGGGHGTTTK